MKRQYHLSGMGRRGLQKVMWFVGLPGYAGSDKKGTIASEEETYYSGEEQNLFLGGPSVR